MRNKNSLAVIMALFVASALGNNARADDFTDMRVAALSPGEMDSLRGGFLMAGGMTIDFSIIRQSSVNGQLQQQLSFDSRDLARLGNSNSEIFKQIPNLTTIIRNSADNALIQNLNTLNITATNSGAVRNAMALAPLMDSHLLR